MLRIAGVALAVLLSTLSSFASACASLPETIEGLLRETRRVHPNGSVITALQVVVKQDILVVAAGRKGCSVARIIQVVPRDANEGRMISSRIGQIVRIKSPDIFESHTAWHVGDAVAMQATLDR
jgi:hypothetical protein